MADESKELKVQSKALNVQEKTFKKVNFIGNVLEKSIVPASVQKEKDKEEKSWQKKLFGFMGGGKGKEGKPGKAAAVATGGGILGALSPKAMASTIAGGAASGLKGLWKGASKAFSSPKVAKIMGPLAIAGGVALMVKDGMKAMKMSKEWGVSKTSAAMGGVLGGLDSGFKGAMANMGKWALIGAGIGSMVPIIGTLVGGLIGAVVGAILGWIGGEKIAKFFASVGKWASEKWTIIKAFPGKIWNAIVNTVKGWLGFGDGKDDELPVTAEGEPKKGWLDTLIDFLIPQWLIDFGKDALGTVLGWLGLKKKDDTGKTTTTAMGKKIFGTIGEMGDIFMSIIGFFIPDSLIKLVADPMGVIKGWFAPFTKDVPAGEEPQTLKDKIFGTIGKVGEVLMNILGFFIPKSLIAFVKDPLGVISTWFTTEKSAAEKEDPTGLKSKIFATIGAVSDIVWSVLSTFIPDALVNFVKDPLGIIKGWFAPFTKDVPQDQKPQTLKEKIFGTIGKIGDVFMNILGYWIPDSIIAFVKDPLGIIKQWFAPLTADVPKDQKPQTLFQKIFGTIGKIGDVLMNIIGFFIPQVIIDFVKNPLDTIKGWFTKEKDKSVKDDPNSLKSKIFTTIGDVSDIVWSVLKTFIPDSLIKFVSDPMGIIKGWFAPLTATGDDKPQSLKDKIFGTIGAVGDVIMNIIKYWIPTSIINFVKDPMGIIEGWFAPLAATDDADKPTTLKDKIFGTIGKMGDVLMNILKYFIPQNIIDFVAHPIDTIMGWFTTQKDAALLEDATSLKSKIFTSIGSATTLVVDILKSFIPQGIINFASDPLGTIKGWLNISADTKIAQDKSADLFFSKWRLPTWDSFKELLPKWLSDPVGWVKGLFKKGEEVGQEEKFRLEAEEREKGILEHGQTLKGAEEAGLYTKWGRGFDSDINREELTRAVDIQQVNPEMLQAILDDKDLSEQDTAFMKELLEKATNPGSLFVQDIRLHDLIKEGNDFWKNTMLLSNIAQTPEALAAAGTSNAIQINTPNTTNQVIKNTMNTAIGTTDPFTTIARVY